MERMRAQFVGVELYFENLETAKKFYVETMGLEVSDEQVGHHAKLDGGKGFVCLERSSSCADEEVRSISSNKRKKCR